MNLTMKKILLLTIPFLFLTLSHSAIRVSFGKNNTMSDVEALLDALHDIIEMNQQSAVMMAATV